ncbi:MAG: hypothetical protein P8Q97_07905 [Myxococcota bacterium]|nr:hypothetical protein [Myxococcota bacterium]
MPPFFSGDPRRFDARRARAVLSLLAGLVAVLGLALPGPSGALALGRGGPGESSGETEEAWLWQKVSVAGAEGPLLAVTVDPSGSRVAVADAQGALVGTWTDPSVGPGGWRRVARVGGIRDLHFDGDGALWIASLQGLWHWNPAGRLEERSPGPGEAARRIVRVISSGELRVAVGAGGAFLSTGGGGWRRLLDGLPLGSFHAVGLARGPVAGGSVAGDAPGWVLWLLADRELWRVDLSRAGESLEAAPGRRVRIPGRPLEGIPSDLFLDLFGSELVVVYPRALARTLPGRVGPLRWEIDYPVWPAGASALRIAGGDASGNTASVGGRAWLATDRGLLSARSLLGPWRRAGSPLAGMPIVGIAPGRVGGQAFVLAAGPGGLYRGHPSVPGTAMAPPLGKESLVSRGCLPAAPSLARVRAEALRRSGLGPDYFRSLRAGLGRRAWWPALALRAGGGADHDRERGWDQSFTYGELHDLLDRSDDRSGGFDASITLAWDLGDLAYPADAPELSREARQVISLRDNVLDELTQLYFDRRRALLALDSQPDKQTPEAELLRLRAEELAAGLDAWTGGWFSAALRAESGAEADSSAGCSPLLNTVPTPGNEDRS